MKKHTILILALYTIINFTSCKKDSAESIAPTNCSISTSGVLNGSSFFEDFYYDENNLLKTRETKYDKTIYTYNINKQIIQIENIDDEPGNIYSGIYTFKWEENKVTEIEHKGKFVRFNKLIPIYKGNKLVKLGTDSLVYDERGNLAKIFAIDYKTGKYEIDEIFEYDNKALKYFSFEFTYLDFEYFPFIKNTNNMVKAKATSYENQNRILSDRFNVTFEYDKDNNPIKMTGIHQDKPVNLIITYNCK